MANYLALSLRTVLTTAMCYVLGQVLHIVKSVLFSETDGIVVVVAPQPSTGMRNAITTHYETNELKTNQIDRPQSH